MHERSRPDVVHGRGENEHPAPPSRLDRDRARKSLVQIWQALAGGLLAAPDAAREDDEGRQTGDGAHARVLHLPAFLRSPFSGARRGEKVPRMATRITYTSGASDPELDARFEQALDEARGGAGEPLRHVVAGAERDDGPVFERPNPSHADEIASRAHEADAGLVGEALARAREAQPGWRSLPYARALFAPSRSCSADS